ncbi:MAG TPA: hypothetical protein DCE42_00190 [Myxococcales bacterium]|nr:hypothetical protein [Deltaproteobacteria bacterium]HAA53139.1 hypothetical protein [Myxococcales bacterium]
MKTALPFFAMDRIKKLQRSVLYIFSSISILFMTGCPSKTQPTRPNKPVTRAKAPVKRYQISVAHTPWRPTRGAQHAPLQIVELLNPLDAQTRRLHKLRPLLWHRFPGAIRWQVQLNPTLGKDRGYLISRALLVAKRLGVFWPYLSLLMRAKTSPTFEQLCALAKQTGVDPQRFEIGLQVPTFKILVDRDMRWAHRFGLLGRSYLFVNGRPLAPPYTQKRLLALLKDERTRVQKLLQNNTPKQVYGQLMKTAQALPKGTRPPAAILGRRYMRVPFGHLEGTPMRGPGDAPIRIIEYSDFTCVPCRKAYFLLHHTLKTYPDKVKFYFKYYPIGVHKESYRVSELAAAAQDRRKFWPLYDLLFQKQKQVFQGRMLDLAQQVGLDKTWLAGELDRRSYRRRVLKNRAHGQTIGIRGVPMIILNGYRIPGVPPRKVFLRILKREMWKSGVPDPAYP